MGVTLDSLNLPAVTVVSAGASSSITNNYNSTTPTIDPTTSQYGGTGVTLVFTGGGGTGAIGNAIVNSSGVITSITLISGGGSYGTAPTGTVVGGGGSGATFTTAVMSGAVITLTLTAGGTGYQYQPTPGYQFGRFVISSGSTALSANPAANSAISLFFRLPADGTQYNVPGTWENAVAGTAIPTALLRASRLCDVTSTTQNLAFPTVQIPEVPFQVIVMNNATGVTWPSGWSLTLQVLTDRAN